MRYFALFFLFLLGCASPEGTGPSAGVPVVQAEELLRIGSIDGGDDSFAPITALAVSPDGSRVIVLENQTRLLKSFDSEGHLIRVVGGAGGGPGEFGNPMAAGVFGDTVWVADVFTYRYSLFSLDGVFLTDFRPTVLARQGPDHRPPRPSSILDDGTLTASILMASRDIAKGLIDEVPILLMDRGGAVLDTLGWRSLRNTAWMIEPDPRDPERGEVHTRQPFGPRWPQAFSGVQGRAYFISEGDSAEAVLECTDLDGNRQFRVPVGWEGPALDPAEVESFVETRLEALAQSRFGSGVTKATLQEWIEASLYVPERRTPVGEIKLNSNEDIWLLLSSAAIDGPQRWRVFKADGSPRFDALLPLGVRLHAARGDILWGVVHDELDVPFIVKLRLIE